MKNKNSRIILLLTVIFIVSCGTLGHIQFYYYNAPKYEVEKDLLNIINDSIHTVPHKWKEYAVSWDFLDEKFVYFRNNPEEIYRLGFTGDTSEWNHNNSNCILGITGLFQGEEWQLEKNLSNKEQERMKERFEKEILSKMHHQYRKEE